MFKHNLFFSNKNNLQEWCIIELQGDLEIRGNKNEMTGKFIGDLSYDKYGQPILIIGHHILHGKEQKLEKPFAVLKKVKLVSSAQQQQQEQPEVTINDIDANETDKTLMNENTSMIQQNDISINQTVLNSTIAIEHKTKYQTEYHVQAIITKRLIFKSRPKPIIVCL